MNGGNEEKYGKFNESVDKSIKRIDGLGLDDYKKPLIMLKRTKIFAGARIITDEVTHLLEIY